VLLLGCFVWWQRVNRRAPLLPLRIFSNRTFSAGASSAVVIGFVMTSMPFLLVIYIQSVLGLSPTAAGLLIAPMALLSGTAAPFVGRMSDRMNPKYLVMFGMFALSAGLGVIALVITPASAPAMLIPGLLLCGLGVGFVFSPLSNVTISSVDRTLVGSASGIFNTARQVGGVLGSAAVGVLLQMQISASTVRRANEAALALPAEFRPRLVSAFADAAGGATPALPADLPPEIADQARHLVAHVIQNGLTDAVKISLLLPVGVLAFGLLVAAALRPSPVAADSGPRS
jgi:MFS family permease